MKSDSLTITKKNWENNKKMRAERAPLLAKKLQKVAKKLQNRGKWHKD